jgi:hypothetical protein
VPKLIVERSLFEPIQVDINGTIYTALPFGNRLIKAVNAVSKQIKDKTIDGTDGTVKMAALIFGKDIEEFDQVDIRALVPAIDFVTAQMVAKKGPADEKPADAPPVEDGPGAEKKE